MSSLQVPVLTPVNRLVTPPDRPGGWRVTDYPADILQLDGSAAAAPSHTFDIYPTGSRR
jgi:hypothetical protein